MFKDCIQIIKEKASWFWIGVFSLVFGAIGAFLMFVSENHFFPPQLKVGTVNITVMVDQFIQQELEKKLSPDLLKKEVRNFGLALDKELKTFTKEKNMVLFPREAIVAGGIDYTAIITQRMKENLK